MKTIEESWQGFKCAVIDGLSESEFTEETIRKAYSAGAANMFGEILGSIAEGNPDQSKKDLAAAKNDVKEECFRYIREAAEKANQK